jgi:hypothetical protein
MFRFKGTHSRRSLCSAKNCGPSAWPSTRCWGVLADRFWVRVSAAAIAGAPRSGDSSSWESSWRCISEREVKPRRADDATCVSCKSRYRRYLFRRNSQPPDSSLGKGWPRRRCAIIAAMEETTPNELFLSALDALLTAVAKSADDLHLFYDTVAKAPLAPSEPFPRAFVILAERVFERLTQLDQDLEEVLVELGLTRTEPPKSSP